MAQRAAAGLQSLSRSWRKRLRRVAIAALVLVALDSVIWAAGCLVLERVSDGAAPVLASQGWAVAKGVGRWSGWPVACAIEWPDVALTAAPGVFPPGLDWRVERLRLELGVTRPRTALLRVFGAQWLSMAGVPGITGRADSFVTEVDLTGTRPPRTEARQFVAALPGGTATIGEADFEVLPSGWAIGARDAALPGMPFPIKALAAQVAVAPPFPAGIDPAASARAWRNAGGRIQLERSALLWGPLAASATGTLGLTEELQPEGDGQLLSTGAGDLIEALARAGTISRGEAVASRAVLAIVSAPQTGGALTVPMLLHGGVLSVAGVPVLRFAPLRIE